MNCVNIRMHGAMIKITIYIYIYIYIYNIKWSCLVLILFPDYALYITFQVTQLLALYYCCYKTGRLTGMQLAIQSAMKNTNKTRTSSILSISLTLQPQKESNQQPRSTKSISRRNNKKQNDQCKMLVNLACPVLCHTLKIYY